MRWTHPATVQEQRRLTGVQLDGAQRDGWFLQRQLAGSRCQRVAGEDLRFRLLECAHPSTSLRLAISKALLASRSLSGSWASGTSTISSSTPASRKALIWPA